MALAVCSLTMCCLTNVAALEEARVPSMPFWRSTLDRFTSSWTPTGARIQLAGYAFPKTSDLCSNGWCGIGDGDEAPANSGRRICRGALGLKQALLRHPASPKKPATAKPGRPGKAERPGLAGCSPGWTRTRTARSRSRSSRTAPEMFAKLIDATTRTEMARYLWPSSRQTTR